MKKIYRLEHPNVNLVMNMVADSEDRARSQTNKIMTHRLAAAITKCDLYLCKDHELVLRNAVLCGRIL